MSAYIEYSSLTITPSSDVVMSEDTLMWRDVSAPNLPTSFHTLTFDTLKALILATVSSSGITYGTTVPANSAGNTGDSYINRATGILYEKGASTWSSIGVLALSASNSEVTFATPSAGNKSATLG